MKVFLKLLLISSFLFFSKIGKSQKLTKDSLIKIVERVQYFDESKKDSLRIMATKIRDWGKPLGFKEGELYFYRFNGWADEYDGKYDQATSNYLKMIELAEKYDMEHQKYMAVADLAAVYVSTKQLDKAKRILLDGVNPKNIKVPNEKRNATFYNNLGVIYKRQEKYDSAMLMYKRSLDIKLKLKDEQGIANQKINLAPLLVKLKRYGEAEKMLKENLEFLKTKDQEGDVWENLTNLGGLKIQQGKLNEAEGYLTKAIAIAEKLDSKQKKAAVYSSYAELMSLKGSFKEAYENALKASRIKEELVNSETNDKISELQEKFNAVEREKENKLLSSQLESEKLKQWLFGIGALMLGLFAIVIGFALRKNRKKNIQLAHQNDLITQQKDKLTELNIEKNNLISIVSHDLRSPFNAIALWNETLQQNIGKSPLKVAEATEMIAKTASYGQQMINNILDIEKMEINTHKIDLKPINVSALIEDLVNDFEPASKGKNITIKIENLTSENQKIISDYNMLRRAIENLMSNALKFSYKDSTVQIKQEIKDNKLLIKVKDFGVGIPENQHHLIFGKYGKTSSIPTDGEVSTGLGLNIVKRICDELGGTVSFTSEENKGSEFIIELALS
jgi:signal transduction histidine kinase